MKAKRIGLTGEEIAYLILVVAADLKQRSDEWRHAVAYGGGYEDPDIENAGNILSKITNEG